MFICYGSIYVYNIQMNNIFQLFTGLFFPCFVYICEYLDDLN